MPAKPFSLLTASSRNDPPDAPPSLAGVGPAFDVGPRANRLLGGKRAVLLWTREAVEAAALVGGTIPRGGGPIEGGVGWAFEPPLYWGKKGTLPRPPLTAVIGWPVTFGDADGAAFQAAFQGEYDDKLSKLGVHVYFRALPFANATLAGPAPLQTGESAEANYTLTDPFGGPPTTIATTRYSFQGFPADQFVGGRVYWARVGVEQLDVFDLADVEVIGVSTYTAFTSQVSTVTPGNPNPGTPPAAPTPPAGFFSLGTVTKSQPLGGSSTRYVRYDFFANVPSITADAAALRAIVPRFDRFRFTYWSKGGTQKLSAFTEGDTDIPFSAINVVAQMPADLDVRTRTHDGISGMAASLADDIAAFFSAV